LTLEGIRNKPADPTGLILETLCRCFEGFGRDRRRNSRGDWDCERVGGHAGPPRLSLFKPLGVASLSRSLALRTHRKAAVGM